MYHNAERRAKELNIELTIEDIHELYNKQKGLCAISGLQMTHETYAFIPLKILELVKMGQKTT
jgi:hypothetical protein